MARTAFLGRIRRVGLDTVVNYSFLATSDYDSHDPAASTGAWSDSASMDQDLTIAVPPALTVTAEGCLVTFERLPFRFYGLVAKVLPTFTEGGTDTTAIELWTHNGSTDTWTLRRRIILADPFSGARSGEAKFFDLRLATGLSDIDKVWVTMAPALGFTPAMEFAAIHPFGSCHERIITPGSCEDDPNVDCLPGDDGGPLDEPLDCHDFGPDVCDLPPFDWPRLGKPYPGGGPGPSDPPDAPIVDLCDPVALQAFKDSMTPEQLAYFEELLSTIELPCLPPQQEMPIQPKSSRQPTEVYVDPQTGVPGPDPRGNAPLPVPLPTPSIPSDPSTNQTTTATIILAPPFTADPGWGSVDTDVKLWAGLVAAAGGNPLAEGVAFQAGTHTWAIVHTLADTDWSGRVVRIRYDGFLSNAKVNVECCHIAAFESITGIASAQVVFDEDPSAFFAHRLSPSGSGLISAVEAQWEDQTTGSDFTMTGGAGQFAMCVIVQVRITQDGEVDNLRIEVA